MGAYLSPIEHVATVRSEANATVALSATTLVTTPNNDDYAGALYQVNAFVRVNTLDGGTTPTLGLNVVYTEGGSARTKRIPLQDEAGATAATFTLGAAGTASGHGVIRADKNTNIQWSRTAGGTPSNNGDFDVFLYITRIA